MKNMRKNYKKLGDYIRQIKVKNTDGKCDQLLGINIDKFFMPSVANIVGTGGVGSFSRKKNLYVALNGGDVDTLKADLTYRIYGELDNYTSPIDVLGSGNTDARVLAAFADAGIADHMQPDVLRGMIECKHMLRRFMGTSNVHTFGVAGTGWSGLDCMMSAVMPGDTVVAFSNGTFSGIDALTMGE